MKRGLFLKKWRQLVRTMQRPYVLPQPPRIRRIHGILAIAILGMGSVVYGLWLNQPPRDFPLYQTIDIDEGMSTGEIVDMLYADGVVRSKHLFQIALAGSGRDNLIQAGSYLFDEPLTTIRIVRAITGGEYLSPPVRITIPEGLHGAQIVELLEDALSEEAKLSLTSELFDDHIGYLFPDTYLVPDDFTPQELVALMRRTYAEKTEPLAEAINASDMTEDEIVTLASIVVREAHSKEAMRTVAGILLNRLAIDMPLQVDASFYYLLEKTSAEVTQDDLALDSPYNTYKYTGLPPTPIANPGLQAIEAVLDPIPTEYFFYLTAADGTFYYAETFDQHVANKRSYLQ